MKHLCTLVLIPLVFFLTVSFVLAAKPDSYPEVMFILDGSGSMWGKVGNETKIEAAKKVLHQVVPSIPEEVRVGLTVYGHRRKGDCSDIEVMLPPGSTDRNALLSMSDGISPKGMTPIADSISKVADLLKTKENETTIILISDGKETCNEKPCEAVRKLKQSGIKFILHVVGFDVNAREKAQLECLSKAGGGKYFSADSAISLLAALDTVKKEVAEKVEKVKTVTKKSTTMLGKLHITMPPDSTRCLATIKIIRKADGKVVKLIKNPPVDSIHPLLKGEYKIIAGYANSNFQPDSEAPLGEIEVKGGETTELSFGALAINIADELKKMPVDAVVIASEDNPDFHFTTASTGNTYYFYKTKPLPPGKYSFAIGYGTYLRPIVKKPIVFDREIPIEASKTSTITIDAGIKIKKPQQTKITAWELLPEEEDKAFSLRIEAWWHNDYPVWAPYAVFPGKYNLVVFIEGMTEPIPVGQGLEIKKGEIVEFDTGL